MMLFSEKNPPTQEMIDLPIRELDKRIEALSARLDALPTLPTASGYNVPEQQARDEEHSTLIPVDTDPLDSALNRVQWLWLMSEQSRWYDARTLHIEQARDRIARRLADPKNPWWEMVRVYNPASDAPGSVWAQRFAGDVPALIPVDTEPDEFWHIMYPQAVHVPSKFQIAPEVVGWGQLDSVLNRVQWLWSEDPDAPNEQDRNASRIWGRLTFDAAGGDYQFHWSSSIHITNDTFITFIGMRLMLPKAEEARAVARREQDAAEAEDY